MKILITGATGLLGSHLAVKLLKSSHELFGARREKSSLKLLNGLAVQNGVEVNRITWEIGDLTDPTYTDTVTQGMDIVIHTAAYVSFTNNDYDLLIRNNADATANVANSCLRQGVQRLIHISSIAALGDAPGREIDENTPRATDAYVTTYGLSKYLAEMHVWRAFAEGLQGVILNPSLIIGQGNWTNDSSALIGRIAKGLNFYPGGCTGMVDVNDVVTVITTVLESTVNNERYIVNGDNICYKELFEKIALNLGVKPPSIYARPWMTSFAARVEWVYGLLTGHEPIVSKDVAAASQRRARYSNYKAVKQLGVTFTKSDETLKRVCSEYLQSK
ncbi:MAG: NAD-dependent epimerase/dehydratase family protein [Bacteroidetes bacterium]|nr:NAD-dependent epimerase/dehydratase family protein [Bacteroidota bacterium]